MTTNIQFPQVPIVDMQTGMLSLEWFEWLQNPKVLSIIIGTAIDLASGGTGANLSSTGGAHEFLKQSSAGAAVTVGPILLTDLPSGVGTGSVTTVSVVTANGVSGTVANPTTTPAITLALGAITPSSVNKVTITQPATGSTLTIADGKTLTASKTMQLTAADDTGVYTFPTGAKTLLASDGTGASLTAVDAITLLTKTWAAPAAIGAGTPAAGNFTTLGATGAITGSTTVNTGGYTVATLPAGTIGMRAYVTDALAPTFLGILTGGGAVITPCFYNGTNWIAD